MKEGWTYKKLGEVCEVISGQSPEGKYYNTERKGIPFYQGKKDFSLKYIGEPTMWTTDVTKIAEKDDLLMSVRAPVGDVNFATQRLCIGRGLAAIRTKGKVDKEYLFYFLLAKKNNIKGKEGVGFASINRKEIMDIDIHYPDDLSEQLSIVSHLDAAFAHIDVLKANAEKQLAEACQLFQAELAECMRPKEGWEEKKLGEVCEVISGQSPEGKFYNTEGNGTPFYQGKKDFTLKYVGTPTMWTTEVTKLAEKDDILMSVRAPVGDVNFATQKICIGRGLAAIRTKRTIDKGYLFYYLVAKKSSIKGKEGVGFASINRKEIMDIDIQFPNDISEQRQIVSRLDALSANIKKLEELQRKTLAECDALKQAMLREVFE